MKMPTATPGVLLVFLSVKMTGLVLLATFLEAWKGYNVPYVTELFGAEVAMFTAMVAKTGYDYMVEKRVEVQQSAISANMSPF